MIPLWTRHNVEHLEKHGVDPAEASEIVQTVHPPYPERIGDEKWSVWGRTNSGRFLQVIFVIVPIEDIQPDEYEDLRLDQRLSVEAGKQSVRIIHARDLTAIEKRRLRRRKRGTS